MALKRFEAQSILTIDGARIAVALQQAMDRMHADCEDRPAVAKARTVTLTVTMKPRVEEGELDSINVTFGVSESVPKRESRSFNMEKRGRGIFFNEASPDDVKQGTLDEMAIPKGGVKNVG